MVGGFATVSGGVLAAYIAMLQGVLPRRSPATCSRPASMNAPGGAPARRRSSGPRPTCRSRRDTLTIERREDGRERDRGRGGRRRPRACSSPSTWPPCSSPSSPWLPCSTRRRLGGRPRRPARAHPAGDPGHAAAAAGLGDGRALAGHGVRGRPDRPQDRCSTSSWRTPSSPRDLQRRACARPAAQRGHRRLRAPRLRELLEHRHPDRRHRRPGPRAARATSRRSACAR